MGKLFDEQFTQLKEFIDMSDVEFYEKFVINALLEEQAAFMQEFPEFMKADPMIGSLEEDEIFQKIKRELKHAGIPAW